ncbi:MAG: pilus assembly PilX N-terminal domain-containing protein [Chthoniobacterales bacterium]
MRKLSERGPKRVPTHERAFALTISLIIIVLATIIVVAFLTTISTERTTAAAYARVEKAEQMAQAGVDVAIARLITEMKYRPYHAIGYRSVNTGLNTQVVPVITGPRSTDPAVPTYNTAPNATEDVYLVSVTGGAVPGATPPNNLTVDNSVDLNRNNLASEPNGWIGSPSPATPAPTPYRAPWVNILSDPTKPEQPDPTQGNYNPLVGRYAFWIEDESSKLDISTVGNTRNGGGFQRGNGADVSDLDIGTLPIVGGSPLPASDPATNSAILNLRAQLPMLDGRFLNRVGGTVSNDVHETTKFYASAFSLSDELAGTGRRRANINALVTSPPNSNTAVPAATIAANVDDIVYVISGTHLVAAGLGPPPPGGTRAFEAGPTFANTLTNFGGRFFASATADQKNIYLEKLAANIRDYIDTDSQPTIIDAAGPTVRATAIPAHPIQTSGGGTSGTSEIVALGKERVPLIQEYALRIRQIAFGPRTGALANYTIAIDHYIELWNPTNRDIQLSDLGPSPFLLIANQPGWDAGSFTSIPEGGPRDLRLYLNAATNASTNAPLTSFPAGGVVVLTTDPTLLPALTPDPTRVFRIAITPDNNFRTYSGQTNRKSGSNLRLNMVDRTTSSSDYETEIALGNNFGLLESAWGGGAIASAISVNIDGPENRLDDTKYHFRGASLRGNNSPPSNATTGDPRTNAEQLRFDLNGGAAANDKTRYYSSGLQDNNIPSGSTLGAPNSNYVLPANWIDYSSIIQSANSAPAVVANASLTSIGQLGDIFDPIRTVGDSGDITLSRSGGRTLKIGQPDVVNGVAAGARTFNANWFNSAWRLADLFDAFPVTNASQPPQPLEAVTPPTARGKININGVLRDDGTAFRAALRSFSFVPAPDSDPQLNGQPLSTGDVDNLIASAKAYLTNNGPLMERGELSQLSFFNPTAGNVAGQPFSTTNDRGREEIFRRTIQMITTRSASFTVYAIGEAVRQERGPGGTWRAVTTGQKRLAITFHLEPQATSAPLGNSAQPHAVVDSYRVRKIYAPN